MIRTTAAIWALVTALLLEGLVVVSWWRPYCDRQEDGPGAMAFGFPLPYGEPSVALSLTWHVMPLAYAFDIAVLAGLAYPVARWAFGRLRRGRELRRRRVPYLGLVALAVVITPQVILARAGALRPEWSIADKAWNESYLDFRPAVWALHAGHKACER